MIDKLMIYLRYEERLLEDLVKLAKIQQSTLIKMQLADLEEISLQQEEMLTNLKNAEEARIKFLMEWLNITKSSATKITMSQIINYSETNNYSVLLLMQESMNSLTNQLVNINIANKILTNRAKNSVNDLIGIFTNGTNNVYNIRV
jgi:hypothetical protein